MNWWEVAAIWVPILISLVALGVSITTAVQSSRRHPRPRIEGEVSAPTEPLLLVTPGSTVREALGRTVAVANYGNGEAHDVRVIVRRRSGSEIKELGTLGPGVTMKPRFAVVKNGSELIGVELSWWQYPARRPKRRVLSVL